MSRLLDDGLDDELVKLPQDESAEFVPGVASLLLKVVAPRPYPINIYNFDNDKASGIAGTLYPDGTFKPLPPRAMPRETLYWDEVLAKKVPGDVVWDGVVTGTLELSVDGPHRRVVDVNSITGMWPVNPPRPDRLVSPEKAREAALEAERENKVGTDSD